MYILFNELEENKFSLERLTSNIKRESNITKAFYTAELVTKNIKEINPTEQIECVLFNAIPTPITNIKVINDDSETVLSIDNTNEVILSTDITRNIDSVQDRLLFRFDVNID